MKRTVKDLVNLKGKTVIVRVDFNVPIDDGGKILDATRILQALPTIKYLISKRAKVVLISHLGRPDGFELRKSLYPIALLLMKLLPVPVMFTSKVLGKEVEERIKSMRCGSVLLLENIRFYKEETDCDMNFAKEISKLGDIFVNDAFAVAHREHATTFALARFMPNALGLLMEKEVSTLNKAIENPQHPFVVIIGGAKVKGKIKFIKKLLEIADTLIIGGAMAYTFLVADGKSVGNSIIYDDCIEQAKEILNLAENMGKKILLPVDHVCIKESSKKKKVITAKQLVGDMVAYDIGKKSIKLFKKEIKKAKQIIWNGPLGKFEDKRFLEGTNKIAKAVALSKGFSIVGGGDSVSAVKKSGYDNKIDLISTGGGATLKFIENGTLPCIEVIQEKIRL